PDVRRSPLVLGRRSRRARRQRGRTGCRGPRDHRKGLGAAARRAAPAPAHSRGQRAARAHGGRRGVARGIREGMRGTLIVRLPHWLGDTVMAVPALRALRDARGDTRVAFVGPWATLLAGQGLADVLVPYGRAWGARLTKWDEVRALAAAAAILLPNSFESALA